MHSLVKIARSGMLANLTPIEFWTVVKRPDKIDLRNRKGGSARNNHYFSAGELEIIIAEIHTGATCYEIAKLFVTKDRKRCAIEHHIRDIRKKVDLQILSDKYFANEANK